MASCNLQIGSSGIGIFGIDFYCFWGAGLGCAPTRLTVRYLQFQLHQHLSVETRPPIRVHHPPGPSRAYPLWEAQISHRPGKSSNNDSNCVAPSQLARSCHSRAARGPSSAVWSGTPYLTDNCKKMSNKSLCARRFFLSLAAWLKDDVGCSTVVHCISFLFAFPFVVASLAQSLGSGIFCFSYFGFILTRSSLRRPKKKKRKRLTSPSCPFPFYDLALHTQPSAPSRHNSHTSHTCMLHFL